MIYFLEEIIVEKRIIVKKNSIFLISREKNVICSNNYFSFFIKWMIYFMEEIIVAKKIYFYFSLLFIKWMI
jgi:hypothetical protein